MPPRDTQLRIEDMLATIDRIEVYTAGMTFEAFCADKKTVDAVRLVWVIDPKGRKAAVYRSLTAVRELNLEDTLDGEEVVPGFQCALREVLG